MNSDKDVQLAPSIAPSSPESAVHVAPTLGAFRKPHHPCVIIAELTLAPLMNSFSTGLMTIAIPTMARDLGLPPQSYYWPVSVYGITASSLLLLSGSVADVVGSKRVYIVSLFCLSLCVLASGLARTGLQLIGFRVMQGAAVAGVLPTQVGILTSAVPPGRLRNVGLAFTGIGQPLGFSLGSVLGGVFVATVGWRVGWYICAAIMFVLVPLCVWTLPPDKLERPVTLSRLRDEADWVGALIACASLAMLAYALIQVSGNLSNIRSASVIVTLILGVLFIPLFALRMHYQERSGRPALIPNSLWKRLPFVCVCIMVLFSFATMQSMELYCSFFYQNVQKASALTASLQLLPSMILGAVLNLTSALLVDRIPVIYITVLSSTLCAASPLIMAVIGTSWPYWWAAFPAQILQPLGADVLFTVGLLVVSEIFPDKTQSLAGAVFSTAGQFGQSMGLAIVGIIANTVTQNSGYANTESPSALEIGYRAGFWTLFGMTLAIALLAILGLRNVGKIGLERSAHVEAAEMSGGPSA